VNPKRVVVGKRCARQQRDRLKWISNVAETSNTGQRDDRQVVQLVRGNVMAQLAAFSFEQRAFGLDGDRLCSRANLEWGVDARDPRYLHDDARPYKPSESRQIHRKFVRTRRQLRQRVIARL